MCVVTEFLPRENSQYLGKIIRFLGESSTFSHISYRLHSFIQRSIAMLTSLAHLDYTRPYTLYSGAHDLLKTTGRMPYFKLQAAHKESR